MTLDPVAKARAAKRAKVRAIVHAAIQFGREDATMGQQTPEDWDVWRALAPRRRQALINRLMDMIP